MKILDLDEFRREEILVKINDQNYPVAPVVFATEIALLQWDQDLEKEKDPLKRHQLMHNIIKILIPALPRKVLQELSANEVEMVVLGLAKLRNEHMSEFVKKVGGINGREGVLNKTSG